MDRNKIQIDTLYQSFDKSLHKITGGEMMDNVLTMINANPEANNSTLVNIPFDLIGSGQGTGTTNVATGGMQSGKQGYSDNVAGFFIGVDTDGIAKWNFGGGSSFIKWDGSSLMISGGISASSLNIPDAVTANSFHVDSSGNSWWGTNVVTGYATAPANILNTGVATFTKITITGGSDCIFISDTINTSTKTILKDFTFNSTDYSGSFKTGDITWNTSTGAITGGSGILINKKGLIGATSGTPTFTINATTGAITSFTLTTGTITLDTSGYVRGGATDYLTGTGVFLGYSGAAYKFSVGNPAGNYIGWNGTTLTIIGNQVDVQTFDANGTWTKPTGAKTVVVQAWGGGGGGGTATDATSNSAAGGGGGGAYNTFTYNAASLTATVAVTVPAASGAGVAGGSVTFGSYFSTFGGGAGADSASGVISAGGGGGGIQSGGSVGGASTGGAGGAIAGSAGGLSTLPGNPNGGFGGAGGGGRVEGVGGAAVYGGGGGGGGQKGGTGGLSIYGGGGGGGGNTNGNVNNGHSTGGTSQFGGAGGDGTFQDVGGNGVAPGGGGAGGGYYGNGSRAGGSGATGRIVVTSYL